MSSYGVVLLEIVTGMRPTNANFIDGTSLPTWVQSALHGNWVEIIDPALKGEIKDGKEHEVYSVLTLALSCVKESPRDRPPMVDILDALLHLRLQKSSPSKESIGPHASHDLSMILPSSSSSLFSFETQSSSRSQQEHAHRRPCPSPHACLRVGPHTRAHTHLSLVKGQQRRVGTWREERGKNMGFG